MAKAILIDVTKCIGCRGCQVACKEWNDLPGEKTTNRGTYQNPPDLSAQTWSLVTFKEIEEDGRVKWLFRKHQCMHCTHANCVEVCPTGAAHHEGEFVIYDQDKCIGCGMCVYACPFGVPHIDEASHKSRKCFFCIDRVSNGLEPACAKACPTGALRFGERDELLELGRARVEELKAKGLYEARLYGEEELGGLHMVYVLDRAASVYELPESPKAASSAALPFNLDFNLAGVGTMIALPLLWLSKRREEVAGKEGR